MQVSIHSWYMVLILQVFDKCIHVTTSSVPDQIIDMQQRNVCQVQQNPDNTIFITRDNETVKMFVLRQQ